MKKILSNILILLTFLSVFAFESKAQSSADITVSGTLFNAFNDPCTSCTFTVTVTRRDGVAVQSTARTVTSHASTGAVNFTLPRKSFVTFTGNYTVGRYNWRSGISMFLPDQSTIDIVDIQSVEDAVAALVAVSAAPSDAQYVVGTTNGTLSAEQNLGALTTGLLLNTVASSVGTLSTATAGTHYVAPGAVTTSGLTQSTGKLLGRYSASTGAIQEITISTGLSLDGSGNLTATGGGGGTWGSITGTLSSQTDLQSALDLKAPLISPSFTTPTLGVASATSINKVALTAPATGSTLTIADGKTLTASNTITLTATDGSTLAIGTGGTLGSAAYTASSAYEVPLTFSTGLTRSTNTISVNTSQNIATLSNLTSNGLVTTSGGDGTLGVTVPGSGVLAALAVNTGSAGAFVVNGGALGTPSSGVATNLTGTASGLTAGAATVLATARTINGVSFDGSANITVTAAAGTLTGTTLNSSVVSSSLTSHGTVTSGGLGTGAVIGGVTMTLGSDATGDIYYRNASGVLTRLGVGSNGQVLTLASGLPSWATASGGSPGGSSGQFQFNNSGAFGGTTGVTYASSGSPTVSVTGQSTTQLAGLFIGAASSSNAILATRLGSGSGGDLFQAQNSGGTALLVVTANGELGAGITSSLLGRVHGVARAGQAAGFFQATSLDTATVLIARQGGSSTGDLFRGENSAGTALFAVNNSGNVNIGGVTSSDVRLTKFSNAYSAPSISLQGGVGADTLGAFHSGTASYGAAGGTGALEIAVVGASGGRITVGGGAIGFASASATGIVTLDGNRDTEFTRAAARVMSVGNGTAGHTVRFLPDSPAQITADQNNYQAGSGRSYFYRLSSDASRNITGLNPAGGTNQNGEVHIIVNVGSNNIVLVNESASSTAGNRFTNSTGADITLAPNEGAKVWYDGTSSRWRVFKY